MTSEKGKTSEITIPY